MNAGSPVYCTIKLTQPVRHKIRHFNLFMPYTVAQRKPRMSTWGSRQPPPPLPQGTLRKVNWEGRDKKQEGSISKLRQFSPCLGEG